jgi:hypothetical protein
LYEGNQAAAGQNYRAEADRGFVYDGTRLKRLSPATSYILAMRASTSAASGEWSKLKILWNGFLRYA